MSERTIAAIATPLGEASIGVIRISGEDAFIIADKIFKGVSGKKIAEIDGYTALFGEVQNDDGRIDEAVALKFVSPKSYTGENVVEISVHGGTLMVKETLRAVLKSGAVLAAPGEFTKRAFLNGKLDLVKAESVMGLIKARSLSELKISRSVHGGATSKQLEAIEKNIVSAAASIAAYCDYPEEDLGEINEDTFIKELTAVSNSLKKMLNEYDAGKILREGIETVIIGRPNVGKSTLMNLLSGQTRSIVTDVAGTTRDIIEDTVMLGDVPLNLADTAGIRESADVVEKVGVDLARQKLSNSQLVLAVFDASDKPSRKDIELLEECKDKPLIVILNKCDKNCKYTEAFSKDIETVKMSAKSGEGIEALRDAVARVTRTEQLSPDSAILVSERQRQLAENALVSIDEAIYGIKSGVTPDAVGVCVDQALNSLYELTGKRVTETVTEEIFSKFCVGK
ncbi:MAG: tRNA uridine-5-carboxymethylaminomethyl(34) synthesis GTPase MnmE [Ruminococcaceae bacterium]|nr:tRNA uridine-5-carboxymethylaminomethyl(34) synthesis GTPase MnmE [Oscillospiraceae bacterium]